MEQTNVDRALAALEEQHADDPERATMLRLSRRFKTTWIELGEALSRVKKDKSWERWGYDGFESYAKAELKLRADTVEKLTGSFMFLHRRAPEVLKRDPIGETLPSYMAIDYLRRVEEKAEADDSIPKEAVAEVRHKILDEGAPMAKVARLYKDTLFPTTEHQKREAARKDIKKVASKLRDLLAETDSIPKKISSQVGESLDELLSELNAEAKAA
ncbi:MAG: hypothetical protein KIT84_29610 [Labilithrix sp.]|nr:hypothetical protein [Labilithrix sp.]MCW5815220.1 hypothetical protein [Labilithrix sp.]